MELSINQVLDHLGRISDHLKLPERECLKSFLGFNHRLGAILEQLSCIHESGELPPAIFTALTGIGNDLQRVDAALDTYKSKSRFYVLTHVYSLNKTMQDLTQSLGKWISLISLAGTDDHKDLRKKIDDLSTEMQLVKYQVTKTEERSLEALEREVKRDVVSGSLWRDIAGLAGVDPQLTSSALQEQVQLLRKEVGNMERDSELQKMRNIVKLLEHVREEPLLTRMYSFKNSEEDEEPFDAFICPLTKMVMKQPVTVQSEITYERAAIERWFRECVVAGRALTCPVTGTVLTSAEMKINKTLRDTIEQWSQRNSMIRIHQALSQLSSTTSLDGVEDALDSVLKVCEGEGSLAQFRLGKSRFVPLVLEFWKRKMPEGSQVRLKALVILERIAADDLDGQEALIQSGALRAAVRTLSSSQVNEAESAVKLLLTMSTKPEHAEVIGKEKGALIHLLGLSSNSSENSALSILAEKTLLNLEQVDVNVLEMAEAGRLEPLLTRLSNGTVETKVEMAKYLAERIFVNSQKEHVARKAGKVLVSMLSGSPRAKDASLGALLNLSMVEDNLPVLVKAGVLPPVVEIIFSVPTTSNPLRGALKETAAATLANVVSVPGSWETVEVDAEGNLMQSEFFVHTILGLLSSVGPDWNNKLLKILLGVASSPQAADSVAEHVVSGNGVKILLTLLRENGDEQVNVLKLLKVLSRKVGNEVRRGLVHAKYLEKLKITLKVKNGEESILAGSILSNIPLSETELVGLIGLDMVSWCVVTIEELNTRQYLGSARVTSAFLESILGVLLQFSKLESVEAVESLRENKVMLRFKQCLELHQGQGSVLVKERAAAGLGFLSEKGSNSSASSSSEQRVRWQDYFCGISKPVVSSDFCPLHNIQCKTRGNFCLREVGAVSLLLELLEDKEQQRSVQLAAVSALSTLVSDDSMVEEGVKVLEGKGVRVITQWFQMLRSSSQEAQEKGTFLVERILRVREQAERCSLDQGLIKALVEVFKHGSAAARRNAETALARTQMLSVVSGGYPGNSK